MSTLRNPRLLKPQHQEGIRAALRSPIDKERTASKTEVLTLKRKLTAAVLSSIGYEDRQEELEKAVAVLLDLRIKQGRIRRAR